jgi:hypothetical protein
VREGGRARYFENEQRDDSKSLPSQTELQHSLCESTSLRSKSQPVLQRNVGQKNTGMLKLNPDKEREREKGLQLQSF